MTSDKTPRIRHMLLFSVVFIVLLAGCTTTGGSRDGENAESEIGYLAKSDVDTVADIHFQQVETHLEALAEKLYRRNPRYCSGGTPAIPRCVRRIFTPNRTFPELAGKSGVASIKLSFDEDFDGDRVLAFVYGLKTMIMAAYGNKTEFFITDEFDPQKLYNSARNIEIAAWRLRRFKDKQGELWLLSNGVSEGVVNLSFARLFGKLVSLQDTMAKIIAESSKRRVKNVIQRLATAVFLPI